MSFLQEYQAQWFRNVLKQKNVDYEWLSANPNIAWEIVKANKERRYGWLSRNPNITAMHDGQTNCLEYLIENRCPWNESVTEAAAIMTDK